MSELVTVLEAIEREADAGRPVVFCVVLAKRGSAPREPGAAMLVCQDGRTVGTVGGGAIEVATAQAAKRMLPGGNACRLTLSLDDDQGQDDASVCGGIVDVGLVPIEGDAGYRPFLDALKAARRSEPTQILLELAADDRPLRYRMHVETPPTLVIVGAGHVGCALAPLASAVDFRIVVVDDRDLPDTRSRFNDDVTLILGPIDETLRRYTFDPSCYVAIMTRGHRHDQTALAAVIDQPLAYVGMMASRRKAAALLGNLRKSGVREDLLGSVRTPIGVDIGAMSVNEIAVSIVAELIQVRRRTVPKTVEGPLTE